MSTFIDKIQILNAIKAHYSFKTDYEFANYLGIQPTTLSSWYARCTLNWDTIFAKCVDIDFNDLIKHGQSKSIKTPDEKSAKKQTYDKSALEMIRDLSAENALLKKELEDLKKDPPKRAEHRRYGNLAAEP